MNPAAFVADLEAKPRALMDLAKTLRRGNPWSESFSAGDPPRLVLTGMGSSMYAASVAAARMRRHGLVAVADLASTDLLTGWPSQETLAVAISATGGSRETLDAVTRLPAGTPTVALTNTETSRLRELTAGHVAMHAGIETGGVACRSFQHTLILLMALQTHCLGEPIDPLIETVERSAAATTDLLERRADWLPRLRELLVGPDGLHVAAPDHRLSSARQSALMLREGPRLAATSGETGDWAHVDVYLTKNTDYRLLLFSGSRWEDGVTEWTLPRSTTVVSVGGDIKGGAMSLRYRHDEDDDVRLLTETLVAELLAATEWIAQS